jgi:sugar/nucleoside kinase (ribokinase family)
MKPALIIGSTCVDVIINLDHLPRTEENLHPTSQTMALGGCAYNVASIMRLLHVPHTFISPVGTGAYGDFVENHMKKNRIPVTVRVPDQENGCCYCLVEATGERTFLSLHGAEYTFQKTWMDAYPASDYGWAYVCGLEIEEPTGIQLIEYLEEHRQLSVCYAPGPRGVSISPEKNSRMMGLHPLLHINEQEAFSLSGKKNYEDAAWALRQKTENTVIITLGARGAYCLEKSGKAYTVPSVPVTKIGDTIGAGDAHIGAILACLTMDRPLFQAVAYGNKVSAAVVSVHGASLPPDALPPMP